MTRSVAGRKKKAGEPPSPAKKSAAAPRPEKEDTPPPAPVQTREKQLALYDESMRLFHAGEFHRAQELFVEVAAGPNREIAHAARVHRMVCERRLAAGEAPLPGPNDHYDYAIALINRRNLDQARHHLDEALRQLPDADHVHYALALCLGLQGDFAGAASHLARAVEIAPRNRGAARSDPDFAGFASRPEIRAILSPETTRSE
jgi:tetratricopeptide (TPR) repeat protein